MANPNPKISNLIIPPKIAPEEAQAKPIHVRIPASQYDLWMAIPSKERNESLRKFIAEKLKAVRKS